MITTIDTKSAWLAVVLLLATNVASQAAENSTTAVVDISNVAQRLYDPPEDKYSIFKLRQWTQKKEDKAMCAASKNADNLGETLLGLHEEECSISSANQKISYWEIVKDSHVYMIRFAEPRLCLSVTNPNQQATMRPQVVQPNMQGQVPVSNAQAQIPTSNAQGQIPVSNAQGQIPASDTQAPSQQMRLQRRSIGDDFHAPLVHGGHVETSNAIVVDNLKRRSIDADFHAPLVHGGHVETSSAVHLQRRDVTAPDATKTVGSVGVTAPNPIIPANNPSQNASTNGTAVKVAPNGYPMMLTKCTGSDNQLFQMKVVKKEGLPSNYYQIMSYQYKACLASERKNMAQLTLVPCVDNDESQLWLFEDIKQTIKSMDETSTIVDYANAFQIKDFIARMGLSRDRPVRGLTEDERVMVRDVLPEALEVFEMTFDLANSVHIYANSIGDYQRAATVLVSDLVKIFLTPENRPSIWEKIWGIVSMILGFIPIPGLVGVIKGGAQVIGDYVASQAQEKRRNQGPSPIDLAQWNIYALNQVDFASELLYRMFDEVFQKARIGQLREELANFKTGKYTISAETYYKSFQVKFSQLIVSANPDQFWVSVCVSPNAAYCKGSWSNSNLKDHGAVYNEFYSSNLSTDAYNFLETGLQERANFYEGKNGWNVVTRRLYTCPNNNCRERLVLRSGSNKFELVG